MNNFSWLYSVIIPTCVSLISSTLVYIIGARKERNVHFNAEISNIESKLDDIYQKALTFYKAEFSDEHYHYMVYEADTIKTLLTRVNNDIAIFQYGTFKRILTDYLFHKKESSTMEQLSNQIQIIKQNLKRKHI